VPTDMSESPGELSNDDAVRATNDDAANCKRGAVQLGYWRDPYIEYFVKKGDRKPPEINRGYYARTQGIKQVIEHILEVTEGKCQVINLGAGFDTLYWMLAEEGIQFKNFIEVDFPTVTAKKCYYIKKSKPLLQALATEDGEVSMSNWDLHSSQYHLVGTDLRVEGQLAAKLQEAEVDYSLPTIFLAECVLVYMDTVHSTALLRWITNTFTTVAFINYEQVNMQDRFGQVMVENLRKRSCALAGVEACKDLLSQEKRFLDIGWEGAKAWDMVQVYNSLPKADLERTEALEMLDERELMLQLFQHYCMCLAYKDGAGIGLKAIGLD